MTKLIWLASVTGLLAVMPLSATLLVSETTSPAGAFYNYSYTFSEAGTSAAYTDFLLTTADLSPTNVTLNFDGTGAGAWTYLDYSATQIDFFNSATGSLHLGDSLVVTFRSFLPPGSQTAQGFNNNTGAGSNSVTTAGPTAATATPEPASFGFIGIGICAIGALIRRKTTRV